MNLHARGVATLSLGLGLLLGSITAVVAAQDKTQLSTEREKMSYMVGMDVGKSLAAVAQDLDLAAFERSVRHSFAGGKPLLGEAETRATGEAMMKRMAARSGQAAPGMPPGSAPPTVAKDKVGLLVGADVGRSLAPIKDEIELPLFFQGLRGGLGNGKPLLAEAEADALRTSFSARMQAKLQADAAQLGSRNLAEGNAFLAENKSRKGVFTTPSGLQYMVLRQGAGPRPTPDGKVRVNYEGALLDGTVFDSSYARGQPAEFALGQVIAGWTEGVAMMPVGAKYRFWVPSSLAYGAKGMPAGGIGPNATLVFDVELLGVL